MPTGVGSVFFCLPPEARGGSSLWNIFFVHETVDIVQKPSNNYDWVTLSESLKVWRNIFALAICLTKFLLNTIQTHCTDMEITMLCCNLTTFLHIIATHVCWYTCSNLLSVYVATRCRAEKLRDTKYCHTSTRFLLSGSIIAFYCTELAPWWSLCGNIKNLSSLCSWASCNVLDLCVGGSGLNFNYCW